ncbi:MAG: T9SS type A sorting domain-containing protein [Elusimicrobiota bacterium]
MTIDTTIQDDRLNKPQGVMVVDTQGKIYISDRNNDRILMYNSTGAYITQITSTTAGLNKPDGVWVNLLGYIFVSDTNNDRIITLDNYLNPTMRFSNNFNKPAGITIDTECSLYVVDSNNNRVQKFGLPSKTKLLASSPISQFPNFLVSDFVKGEIYAYPNPAKNGKSPIIHIEIGVADKVEIRIYNIAGEFIHSTEITEPPQDRNNDGKYEYEYTWDISDIASGVYIYTIRAKKNGLPDIKATGKIGLIK